MFNNYLLIPWFIINHWLQCYKKYPKGKHFSNPPHLQRKSWIRHWYTYILHGYNWIFLTRAGSFFQEVFRLGQSKGLSLQHLTSKEIEEKLSELLNHEIIDPVLRVWRVYKFVLKKPECDRYLVCSINRKGQYPDSKTGLKPGVTKLSRYVNRSVVEPSLFR
jgi:hypothetical protein